MTAIRKLLVSTLCLPIWGQEVLQNQALVTPALVARQCLELPAAAADERLSSPHEGALISTRCEVEAYRSLGDGWTSAVYRWTSVFTVDTVTENEVVLFEVRGAQVRPVWHARFDSGVYATWRSISPQVARTGQGTTLLSVRSCVSGTGGCGQEFLHRHADGRWVEVKQEWLKTPEFAGRIRHGFSIDPGTLQGEAGFYSDGDPNCCPSEQLLVDLRLVGDSLVLGKQTILAASPQ